MTSFEHHGGMRAHDAPLHAQLACTFEARAAHRFEAVGIPDLEFAAEADERHALFDMGEFDQHIGKAHPTFVIPHEHVRFAVQQLGKGFVIAIEQRVARAVPRFVLGDHGAAERVDGDIGRRWRCNRRPRCPAPSEFGGKARGC